MNTEFRRVFDAHAGYVRRILRRLRVRPIDRDDLSQQVFLATYRKLPEFDGRVPLRHLIHGICLRVASSYHRSTHARFEIVPRVLPEPEVDPDPIQERDLDAYQTRRYVAALSGKLGPDQRAIFVLCELEGVRMVDAARMLGCPLQTAYSRLHAARKAMRAMIERGERAAEPTHWLATG